MKKISNFLFEQAIACLCYTLATHFKISSNSQQKATSYRFIFVRSNYRMSLKQSQNDGQKKKEPVTPYTNGTVINHADLGSAIHREIREVKTNFLTPCHP